MNVATPHGSDKNATLTAAVAIDKIFNKKLQLPTGQIKMQPLIAAATLDKVLDNKLQLPTGQIKMQPKKGGVYHEKR